MRIAIICLLFFLAGCTPTDTDQITTAGLLFAQTKAADQVIQSGAVESAVLSVELDADDLATVIMAFDDYAAARLTLKQIAANPAGLMAAVYAIQAEHDRVANAYGQIKAVVSDNWLKYPPEQKARLHAWQQQATTLEAQYILFVQTVYTQLNSDARQQAVIQLLQTVAQIALVAAA